jgi:hypothetical protein
MAKSVEITITPAGKLTIEAKGFHGGECAKVTAEMEKGLGVVTNRKLKQEYHDPVQVVETLKIKT